MQKRESKEFKEFFERFFIPVCHFIKRYTEEEEVADIAQEVFVKVYEKWNEFDSLGNAKAFLYIAARNLCLDFIKHKKAEANYLSEYMHGEEADDQETFRILHTAIDKLPAQSKQIIMLSMEGLSNAEVGEKLGISVNTVKTLKKNAYAVLRQVLSKEYLLLLFVILRDYSA